MIGRAEQFGKYVLEERLAVGGMAEIFKARVKGLSGFERVVAIKRLHMHLSQDEGLVQMLIDEARLAVRLMHANIGQVFDLGCIGGQYFIVMEYISGSDLHRISRRLRDQNRRIPTPIVLYVVSEMLAGLDYAHNCTDDNGQSLQLVHRDISPQNIMFSASGDIKLVDFGIAKARMQAMQTQAGIIKGKFYYMSPEQAHGQTLDRRTDVFAAGMVLYELLAGRPAYDELGDVALIRSVRTCDFPPPSHFVRDMDPELERIIMKALHKNPRQRFQTARRLQAALVHYMRQRYRPVTKFEAAEFLQSALELSTPTVSPQDSLLRDDFGVDEDSIIFDASAFAMGEPSGFNPFPEAGFQGEEENPFANSSEATYVYTPGDNNPFAIPDHLDEETSPNLSWAQQAPFGSSPAGFDAEGFGHQSAFLDEAAPPSAMPELGPREVTMQTSLPASAHPTRASSPRQAFERLLEPEQRPKLLGIVGGLLCVIAGGLILFMVRKDTSHKPELEPEVASILPAKGASAIPARIFLTINSNPSEAELFVDDELVGETPYTLTMFNAGEKHVIRLEKVGYQPWEEGVTIPDKAQAMDLELEKAVARGVIRVVGVTEEITLELDGVVMASGLTELKDIDTTTPHVLVGTAPDGQRKTETIRWSPGSDNYKVVKLDFEELQRDDALPELPKEETRAKRKPPRRRPPRRKPPKTSPSKDEGCLSVWGNCDEKKPKKPAKKAPAQDEGELDVWGNKK